MLHEGFALDSGSGNRGYWEPDGNMSPEEGLRKGDFKFVLDGKRLHWLAVVAAASGASGSSSSSTSAPSK